VRVEWTFILDHWSDIECDLHETFHIDVESGVLQQRTWRWLRTRINDLITQPSRLHRAVMHHYTTEDKHGA